MLVPDAEIQLVRDYYAAWSRGDLAGMLARAHSQFEARPTLGVLYDHSVYRGHDGIAAWFEEVAGRWKDFDPHVEELRRNGEQIIAFIRLTAARHGQPVDARIAVEHTFRDGLIVSLFGRGLLRGPRRARPLDLTARWSLRFQQAR